MFYVFGDKMSNLREEAYPPTASVASFPALKYDISNPNLKACRKDLEAVLGQEIIVDANSVREAHSGSEWSSYTAKAGQEPLIVVPPSTTSEVSIIMRFCYKWQLPVTAYNSGTSLEGYRSPARGGICIDFRRIVNTLKVREDDLDATIQPAVGLKY